MKVTVFTPTYNRAYRLEKLYQSLLCQTTMDFEWIIVDDGSTDNTEELVKTFVQNNDNFSLRYRFVNNGGKHRAINLGVEMAKGELFFIVDSDDYLTENAIQMIIDVEATIPIDKKNEFCGVSLKKGYDKTKIIGKSFDGDQLDITILDRIKFGIEGDQAEVFYTNIMKNYPFPTYEGENFMTECVVWDRMAIDGYKLRYKNKIIYICEYLPDGLTAHEQELVKKNPKGWGLYIRQCIGCGKIRKRKKWQEIWRFYNCIREEHSVLDTARYVGISKFQIVIMLCMVKLKVKIFDH